MIIDELHSLVPTKRGVHLALTLAYLDTLLDRPVQRIGILRQWNHWRPLQSIW